MFGLEILDIAIGLAFVYLLLSLMCTAINEYIASMLNKRGKELVRGIDQLLADDEELKEAFYSHPLISSLSPPGRRTPSYIPARNFALALLSVTDYARRSLGEKAAAAGGAMPTPVTLGKALDALRTDSAADVSELLLAPEMAPVLASAALPAEMRQRLVGLAVGGESELNQLQDSVEVWFNNAMDRVSGSYKRYTQVALFFIGMVLAFAVNADTIQIWRTLAVDDELREAMVHRAAALVDSIDARLVRADTGTAPAAGPGAAVRDSAGRTAAPAPDAAGPPGAPSTARAEQLYRAARAELDRSSLNLGWNWAEAGRLGVARSEAPADPGSRWTFQSPRAWHWSAVLAKLLGLLITGIALSLGAPFWFDTLNRFINIRGAGRAPDENPRSPEAPGKRAAERAAR
jgi:hypothetical protein